MIAPALLVHRRFAIGPLVTLLFYIGNASLYFVLALYLQQRLGLSALHAGLIFTVLAGGFFATSVASPWIARKLGRGAIFVGGILLAGSHATLWGAVNFSPDSIALMLPMLLVEGFGIGMIMAPLVSAVLTGLPAEHAGTASGVLATVQQLGNTLGVALIGILFFGTLRGPASHGAGAAGIGASLVYLMASALGVAATYSCLSRVSDPHST